LVAVTTDTLLGVAMPVTGGGVVALLVADAVLPDPPQPASRPATAATQAMPRSLVRNLLNIISNTSMPVICWRPARMLGQGATAMRVARPTIERLSSRYLYVCGDETRPHLQRKRLEALGSLPEQTGNDATEDRYCLPG
jgi:hypothetical protein